MRQEFQQLMARLYAVVRQVYQGYTRNNGALTAAAISYFALVSLVPLMLLATSIFGFVEPSMPGGPAAGARDTIHFIRGLVPWNSRDIADTLLALQSARRATGILGIITLLWIGSQFFHVLEDALNRTWSAPRARPYWKGRLVALGLLALCGGLVLVNLGLEIPARWIQSRSLPWTHEQLRDLPLVWGSVAYGIPLLLAVLMFMLIYRIAPNCGVTWREAFLGGLFSGVLWELAKLGFGHYVAAFGMKGYGRIYGSLTGLALLVFWIYYTSNILVIGAEFARSWCAVFDTGPDQSHSDSS